ncbi:MAG TPA: hypothetical protein VJU80_15345 [Solirubrobacteraceae bacterium]|nr:hypothetical protein [Solirubrobacteraceae bacterium]
MRRGVLGAVVVALLLGTAPAIAQPATSSTAQTITATGSAEKRVVPKNRKSNASIAAAVEKAHRASIAGALKEAHEYAVLYAKAVGMKLGSVVSVSDAQNSFYGPGPFAIGPFGPGRFCGTITRIVGRPVKGHKPKLKRVHRCFVPAFASATLTVTYAASS